MNLRDDQAKLLTAFVALCLHDVTHRVGFTLNAAMALADVDGYDWADVVQELIEAGALEIPGTVHFTPTDEGGGLYRAVSNPAMLFRPTAAGIFYALGGRA